MKKGTISVQSENLFPIIKKFLYSDHEIFLRELISNAIDATTKLHALASKGVIKEEIKDSTIEISIDKDKKTLTVKDRGIGMTDEEVIKYLNEVAFSSAQDFMDKFKESGNIIGNFGLGFYSAFMVSEKVEVRTKSYRKKSKGVTWSCEGDPEYTLDENDKKDRGTEIILYIDDENKEFLEDSRIEELLNKYCKFLPFPIKFGTKKETMTEGEGDDKKEKEIEVDNIINNTNPSWKEKPTELTEVDYLNLYEELYPYSQPPMFWIHLNIDHPFNLTGILYFPKLTNNFEVQKNKIQLYSNQVFVTDEVKSIVPEFLTLLHGVIDSPDIPLNVSRSYLQSDANVKKISSYITRKVADKLNDLFKENREEFEKKWEHLGPFVKYGMLSNEKFYDKAVNFTIFKNIENKFFTLEEYKKKIEKNQTDKHKKIIVLYSNDIVGQNSYIKAAQKKGYDVVELDNVIDNHFIQHLEYKYAAFTFVRVDSDTPDNLVQKDEEEISVLSEKEEKKVKAIFETTLKDAGSTITLKSLTPDDPPVQITKPEFMRRMNEMQMMQGLGSAELPQTFNVVINSNHKLISEKLLNMRKEEKKADFANYLYNLALLNQNMLKGEALTEFVNKSLEFLGS